MPGDVRFSIMVSAWSPLAAALSKFEINQFDPGPAQSG